MSKEKKASLLYHYSSLGAFISMAESGTIRFSDIRHSNDKKEISHGLHCLGVRLKNMPESAKAELKGCINANKAIRYSNEQLNEYLKRLEALLFDLGDAVEGSSRIRAIGEMAGLKQAEIDEYKCFAFCLSACDNDIKQWQSYGDSGRGVCLAFERQNIEAVCRKLKIAHRFDVQDDYYPYVNSTRDNKIENNLAGRGWHTKKASSKGSLCLGKILYGHAHATRQETLSFTNKGLLDSGLIQIIEELGRREIDILNPNNKKDVRRAIRVGARHVAALRKHTGFCSEQETRLYFWTGNSSLEFTYMGNIIESKFGLHNHAKPYIDLSLLTHFEKKEKEESSGNTEPVLEIKKIILGPNCEASATDVKWLMKSYNRDKALISVSDSSIR